MVTIESIMRRPMSDGVKSSTKLDVLREISNKCGQSIPTVCQGFIRPVVGRRR